MHRMQTEAYDLVQSMLKVSLRLPAVSVQHVMCLLLSL